MAKIDAVDRLDGPIFADEKILQAAPDSFAAMECAEMLGEIGNLDQRLRHRLSATILHCGRLRKRAGRLDAAEVDYHLDAGGAAWLGTEQDRFAIRTSSRPPRGQRSVNAGRCEDQRDEAPRMIAGH